jgi:pimeloyl-ACP methyl ester carboxylesterase
MSTETNCTDTGEGPAIVFIHGSFATISTWRAIVADLSADFRCVCIKLPGHDGAPEPRDFDRPSVNTERAMIRACLTDLAVDDIHIVGHSYGGVVALAMALEPPVNIRKMTLFEPVTTAVLTTAGELEDAQRVEEFCRDYREAVAEGEHYAVRRVLDFWNQKGVFDGLPDAIKETIEPMTANNVRHWDVCESALYSRAALQAMSVPTTIVRGTESNAIMHNITHSLNTLLGQSQHRIIEGANHFLVTTHARECIEIIRANEHSR